MQFIFRWNGQYYGFIANGHLFDSTAGYRGWVESDGSVWRSDGVFVGNLVGGEYVLLQRSEARSNHTQRARPPVPAAPARPDDRPARAERSGYVDGLNDVR